MHVLESIQITNVIQQYVLKSINQRSSKKKFRATFSRREVLRCIFPNSDEVHYFTSVCVKGSGNCIYVQKALQDLIQKSIPYTCILNDFFLFIQLVFIEVLRHHSILAFSFIIVTTLTAFSL